MARYINPYTDFGFKKLFGEEGCKEQLKDFLNELLPEKHRIKDLTLKQSEQMPELKVERKAIFDIFCESENGTKFIVEMQKAKMDYFKDRTVFYTTFPIKEQAEKGDWNFKLTPVYCIAILDFKFAKVPGASEEAKKDYLSDIQFKDQYCNVFFDKWLYFLKNLEDFDTIPEILNEPVFVESFKKAELANYDKNEKEQYEASLKTYRDMKGVIETAYNDGEQKGIKKGREER